MSSTGRFHRNPLVLIGRAAAVGACTFLLACESPNPHPTEPDPREPDPNGPGQEGTGPPTVQVVRETDNAASATVTPEAATVIEVTGSDGTEYVLTLPPDALLEETTVRLIPIADLTGSPLADGFVAGLHMEPEGLRFLEPATLEIKLPSGVATKGLVGFRYQGDGNEFHFVPGSVEGTVVTILVPHFSGTGGAAAPTDCGNLSVTELSPEAAANQVVACVMNAAAGRDLTAEEIDQINAALLDWFYGSVKPALSGAVDCLKDPGCAEDDRLFMDGANEFLSWERFIEVLGNPFLESFGSELDVGYELLDAGLAAGYQRAAAGCIEAIDRTTKMDMANQMLQWVRRAEVLARNAITGEVLEELCDGFLTTVAWEVELDPPAMTLGPAETREIRATVWSVAETLIGDADITWTSSDATVVSVAPTGPNTAVVLGGAEGSAVITARVDDAMGETAAQVAEPSGVIRGRVWIEGNDNGLYEAGIDQALAGYPVSLLPYHGTLGYAAARDTRTDAAGMYSFEGFNEGWSYWVSPLPSPPYRTVLPRYPADGRYFMDGVWSDLNTAEWEINIIGEECGASGKCSMIFEGDVVASASVLGAACTLYEVTTTAHLTLWLGGGVHSSGKAQR
jgi:hypothetical protein